MPSLRRLAATTALGLVMLAITTPILALNEPAVVTSTYEVLEPETWVGKELPVLEHIDIGEKLAKDKWLLLFYHPDCQKAIPLYEQMARDLAGNEGFLRVALIEVPPYGPGVPGSNATCARGRLADIKEWFVTTPATVLTCKGTVSATWEGLTLDIDSIMPRLAEIAKESQKVRTFATTSTPTQTPQ